MHVCFVLATVKVLHLQAFNTHLRHKNGVSCSITPTSMLTANAVLSYCTSAAICFSSVLITQDSHNSLWRHITTHKHGLPVEVITPAMMLSSPGKWRPEARSVFFSFSVSSSIHNLSPTLSTFKTNKWSGGKQACHDSVIGVLGWLITMLEKSLTSAQRGNKSTCGEWDGDSALIRGCRCFPDVGCQHSLGQNHSSMEGIKVLIWHVWELSIEIKRAKRES